MPQQDTVDCHIFTNELKFGRLKSIKTAKLVMNLSVYMLIYNLFALNMLKCYTKTRSLLKRFNDIYIINHSTTLCNLI